jgi:hypothetical protein
MVSLHEATREDYLFHIYLLISFELWHRRFIDQPVNVDKNRGAGDAASAMGEKNYAMVS